MRARRMRDRTGAWPPVETAIMSGARLTTAGMMKLHSSGQSTTLTGICRSVASA